MLAYDEYTFHLLSLRMDIHNHIAFFLIINKV